MRIGTTEIITVIDGETGGSPGYMYPEQSEQELEKAAPFVDSVTGDFVFSIGSYLIRSGERLVLVDTGIGPRPTPPAAGGGLRSALLAIGVDRADITDVVFTHLHFDHIGWAVQDGEAFFPNAVYRADKRDWDHFLAHDYEPPAWELRATNYEQDAAKVRLAPIVDRFEFWEGDAQILPGLIAWDAPGHTPGTTAFVVESGGERGVLVGDIAHAIPELLHGWAFRSHGDRDAAVASTISTRDRIADEGVLCSGSHFPGLAWGRVLRDGSEFRWVPVE